MRFRQNHCLGCSYTISAHYLAIFPWLSGNRELPPFVLPKKESVQALSSPLLGRKNLRHLVFSGCGVLGKAL
jgi:hypothetical protein